MSEAPNFEIQIATPDSKNVDDVYQKCLAIRLEVFCTEQGFPVDVETDE
jgi:hypothetical protein